MWAPFSWIIQRWIGLFHAIGRTALVLITWYAFPAGRFVAVTLTIVLVYLVTIAVLESRWRRVRTG